ncbi:MAG: hypothetical protein HY207_12270 [Nitrospirae bacterium]|nr:hypothetical protein [Nitrospirota bacterium]
MLPDGVARWALVLGLVALMGCGSASGTPTGDLICQGAGVIVGGKVTFVKRLYTPQGLTGERITKPVRYGRVEIVREVDGSVVASTYTDKNGSYCIDVPRTDSFPSVYPRIASLTDPAKFKIAVTSDSGDLYSRPGGALDASQPGNYKRDIPLPLFVTLTGGVDFAFSGAFNIMDVLTIGAEKAVELTGKAPPDTLFGVWVPGTVFGSGTFGTYFGADEQTGTPYINLSGGDGGGPDAGDHDEFDDDVILHEFGHFMAYSFSVDVSPGGTHYLNDNTEDMRLAWSEGWASFFSAAVRRSPVLVNTYGGDPGSPNRGLSYSYDIEGPHADVLTRIGTPLEDYGTYSTSEVAVSSVLWDLFDGSNEPGDVSSDGLKRVWEVMTRIRTVPPPTVTLDTFATYFGDLFGLTNLAKTAELRRIQWFPDKYEDGDDTTDTAPLTTNGEWTCHTLYPVGDVDYMRFTVDVPRPVTVDTFNLSNGADTALQIVDASGAIVVRGDGTRAENDDAVAPHPYEPQRCNRFIPVPQAYMAGPNNGERFASTVAFDAQPGTYFAKVVASRKDPAAGVMGSYGLLVSLGTPY